MTLLWARPSAGKDGVYMFKYKQSSLPTTLRLIRSNCGHEEPKTVAFKTSGHLSYGNGFCENII